MRDTKIARKTGAPVLMDHPQRFGILPTWAFWRSPEVRANPIVGRLIVPAQAGILGSGTIAWSLVRQHAERTLFPSLGVLGQYIVTGLVGAAVGFAAMCASFGISERLLRAKILANRRRAEDIASSALEGPTEQPNGQND